MGETKIDLTSDEVIIIGGVLEMRGMISIKLFFIYYCADKSLKNVMKPLDEVFMISSDAVLDKALLQAILKKGFSRIPVFNGERTNIIGMIMVKSLLEVDISTGSVPIKDLKLANIPKFPLDHSLFAIFHEFKLGKSHLGIVESLTDSGIKIPIGIVTLEDLIEELLQQEILDETDEKSLEPRKVPVQAAYQNFIVQGMKSGHEKSPMRYPKTERLSPREEGSVSELLLDNKRI